MGQTTVFVNGCFDLLHIGHLEFLRFARSMGDHLTVGVNDDQHLQKKDRCRPIMKLADRMAILRELRCVDRVIPFSDDTPAKLVAAVMPDIYVVGHEYDDQCESSKHVIAMGGRVVMYRCRSISTTGIVTDIVDRSK